MREVDSGSETRLMRRARAAGLTRTEAIEKRLMALEIWAGMNDLTSVEKTLLASHVIMAANTVWPDQATNEYLRKLV